MPVKGAKEGVDIHSVLGTAVMKQTQKINEFKVDVYCQRP